MQSWQAQFCNVTRRVCTIAILQLLGRVYFCERALANGVSHNPFCPSQLDLLQLLQLTGWLCANPCRFNNGALNRAQILFSSKQRRVENWYKNNTMFLQNSIARLLYRCNKKNYIIHTIMKTNSVSNKIVYSFIERFFFLPELFAEWKCVFFTTRRNL